MEVGMSRVWLWIVGFTLLIVIAYRRLVIHQPILPKQSEAERGAKLDSADMSGFSRSILRLGSSSSKE